MPPPDEGGGTVGLDLIGDTMPHAADILAGLKHERAGYVARGLDDRVAQVDAEIERLTKQLATEVANEAEPGDAADGAAHDHGAESDDAQEAATSVNPDDIARRARRGSAKA